MKIYHFGTMMLVIVGIIFSNCESTDTTISEASTSEQDSIKKEHALKLIESKCSTCHNNNIAHENMLAPPFIAVKKHYLKVSENEDEFIEKFMSFVSSPSKDKALMKHAIEKFGLMPAQGTSQEDLKTIGKYLYNNSIEKPEWWDNRRKGHHKNSTKSKTSKEIGLHYAMSAKKALGKQLMNALDVGGPEYAVEFCNATALKITDSVSNHFNADIKRVSDKPRNPLNKATEEELAIIRYFKKELSKGEELSPVVKDADEGKQFYYPITTNGMCLKCHGDPSKDINPETTAKLNELYPDDSATGYGENQIRGIWSILFKETQK